MAHFKIKKSIRKLFRIGVSHLPDSLRFSLFRHMLRLPPVDESIVVKVAETPDEIAQAFQLTHDAYLEERFIERMPHGQRACFYHLLPTTCVVVAKKDDLVIGTFSILLENPTGLPSDEDFNTSLVRSSKDRRGEICALAIRPHYRGGEALFPLVRFMYFYCLEHLGVRYLQIATSPTRSDFYLALLNAQILDDKILADPIVNGALMQALYVDLTRFHDYAQKVYANSPKDKNLYDFFFTASKKSLIFPARKYQSSEHCTLSYDQVIHYMEKGLLRSELLTNTQINTLFHIFGPSHPLLASASITDPENLRKNYRHLVNCNGVTRSTGVTAFSSSAKVKILNVSFDGVLLLGQLAEEDSKEIRAKIEVAPERFAKVSLQVMWQQEGLVGCKVTQVDAVWKDYISYLDQQVLLREGTIQGQEPEQVHQIKWGIL